MDPNLQKEPYIDSKCFGGHRLSRAVCAAALFLAQGAIANGACFRGDRTGPVLGNTRPMVLVDIYIYIYVHA